jgi:hypothetical protein
MKRVRTLGIPKSGLPPRCLFFLEGEYNGGMTTTHKIYPVGEFTPEEKKEIDYIRAYDSEMSHEELMYLHYAKKEYAL